MGLLQGAAGAARFAPRGALCLTGEVIEEAPDTALDLVPDHTDLLERLAGGIRELPVLVADAGEDGAGVAAPHRDHHVGLPYDIVLQAFGQLGRDVDADLRHRLNDR